MFTIYIPFNLSRNEINMKYLQYKTIQIANQNL